MGFGWRIVPVLGLHRCNNDGISKVRGSEQSFTGNGKGEVVDSSGAPVIGLYRLQTGSSERLLAGALILVHFVLQGQIPKVLK
eukprot:1161809-Pelagomonas_calceolata.AAC.7